MIINKAVERRNTMQKELTLEAVSSYMGHPSVDDIYKIISEKHSTISKATVYRNLAMLADEGRIGRISSCDGRGVRYDKDVKPHAHAICLHCGAVIDIMDDSLMQEIREKSKKAEAIGFAVQNQELIFEGICSGCKEKENQDGTERI